MTTTDPTPLAEQIAREHVHLPGIESCGCGHEIPEGNGYSPDLYAAHIATVTEQALKAEWHPVLSKSAQVLDALVMDTPEAQRITDSFVDALRSMANLTEPAHATTERAARGRVVAEERRRLVAALRAKFGVTNRAADYIERLPDGWADQRGTASGASDD